MIPPTVTTMCNREFAILLDALIVCPKCIHAFRATTSLKSSIMNYHFENGRRYSAYRQGQYW